MLTCPLFGANPPSLLHKWEPSKAELSSGRYVERKGKCTPESYQPARLLNPSCKRPSRRKPGADPAPRRSDELLLRRGNAGFTAPPSCRCKQGSRGTAGTAGDIPGAIWLLNHIGLASRQAHPERALQPALRKARAWRPRLLQPLPTTYAGARLTE